MYPNAVDEAEKIPKARAKRLKKKRGARDLRRRNTRGPLSLMSTRRCSSLGVRCPSERIGYVVQNKKNEAFAQEPWGSQTIASKQNPSSTAKRGAFAITFFRCRAGAQLRLRFVPRRRVRFEAESIISPFVNVVNPEQ